MSREATLMDVIATGLRKKYPDAVVGELGDESGSFIEFKKRDKNVEYVFCLSFCPDGYELQDVQVFKGDIVETVDVKKLI